MIINSFFPGQRPKTTLRDTRRLLKKLSVFITATLFITGCHQASITPPVTTISSTQAPEQAIVGTSDHKPLTHASGTTLSCETKPQDSSSSSTQARPLQPEKPNGISADPDQEKIDQALELCNFAQERWEAGSLEDALANLDSAYALILDIDHLASPELSQQKEDVRYLISKRILEIYASRQIVVTGRHEAIPITLNAHVKKEVKRLTGPERRFFIRALERSTQYRPYIVQELKNAGLPEEISWLPLIESGFKIQALSSARALGLWQFIPSTGHKFGLSRNYYIDERMDPEKSTHAAIAYLKELHNLFGDWTTALAAYNCGEFRVLKTIRRQKINYLDNFWDLYQNLPRETARYVPRFLATVHIVNNLEKYGISLPSPAKPLAYKKFDIKKQVRLKDIAKEIGLDQNVLKNLNPELRHALLPPETYALKVPEDKAEIFLSKLDTIKSSYSAPPMFVYHRVRKGDTLSGIAKHYGTSVGAISRCNNIGRSHRIIAGKVLKIPKRNSGGATQAKATRKVRVPKGKTITYKVKRGDNLWIIANRFSTTTKQIMTQNRLSATTLHIGQKLNISSFTGVSKTTASTYRVRSGDSPFLIAKRHNMTLNRLLALNRLNKRSKIYPGQTLIVE